MLFVVCFLLLFDDLFILTPLAKSQATPPPHNEPRVILNFNNGINYLIVNEKAETIDCKYNNTHEQTKLKVPIKNEINNHDKKRLYYNGYYCDLSNFPSKLPSYFEFVRKEFKLFQ
jgi:hypothetical protein